MTGFEDELRKALKREAPPPGFGKRVMARIPERRPAWRAVLESLLRTTQLKWAFAGALAVALMTFGVVRRQQEQQFRAEGERARAEVLTALRIASVKLNTARRKVEAIGRVPENRESPAAAESQRSKI
jgi:hypothetical protein